MTDDSWWVDVTDLDEDQEQVIDLPADGNYLIIGPPGSGKTNLLLLRAKYLSMVQRPNWAVLMFTRSLRDFVAIGSEKYELNPEKISTIAKFFQQILREHGFDIDSLPDKFEERRIALASALANLLDSKIGLLKHLECILVDEVQDCLPQELQLFDRLAKNVFYVGDARQQIYRSTDALPQLKNNLKVIELKHHYRSGEKICLAADVVGRTSGEDPIHPTCNYKETKAPSSVRFEDCTSNDEQVTKLVERLELQLKTYPEELLAVSCPRTEDLETLRAHLRISRIASQIIDDEDGLLNSDGACIYICSMHKLKGLEFRAVHLANMQGVSRMGAAQKRLVFTGFTRAKTALSIYHVGKIPSYLEQAREALLPKRPKPVLKDLFPRKKEK